jgi:hypothetical protein
VTYFVLLAWLFTAGAGALSLFAWLGRRRATSKFPTRLMVAHVGTAVVVLALWVAFMSTESAGWAWAAFGVLNLNNGLGDAILTGRFRGVTAIRSTWWRDYRRAVVAVLRGRRPPAPTLHALAGGVTFFGTLAACLIVT